MDTSWATYKNLPSYSIRGKLFVIIQEEVEGALLFLFSWNYQYKLLLGETVIVTLYTVEGVGVGGLGVNKTTTDSVYAVHFVIILWLLLGG